jgi:prepilin-type N-terminal cleavage/methylation domain-containing protein
MMRFRNSRGFTLVEVLVTLAIVSGAVVPIVIMQSQLLSGVSKWSRELDRFFYARHYQQEIDRSLEDAQERTVEKKIGYPPTMLKFAIKKVSENSALKSFKDLCVQTVSARWRDGKKEREDDIVTFLYKPQPKKQKP